MEGIWKGDKEKMVLGLKEEIYRKVLRMEYIKMRGCGDNGIGGGETECWHFYETFSFCGI